MADMSSAYIISSIRGEYQGTMDKKRWENGQGQSSKGSATFNIHQERKNHKRIREGVAQEATGKAGCHGATEIADDD